MAKATAVTTAFLDTGLPQTSAQPKNCHNGIQQTMFTHGGRPGSDPDTNPPAPPHPPSPPPHPQEVQNVEEVRTRFGPNLAPEAPEFVFLYTVRANFRFYPMFVCTQNARNYMGNPNMYANHETFSDP